MSDAESYYQSLLQQGYDVNQATVYTKEHYPHFVDPMASQPAAPAGAAPAASGTDPMMMMMMMNQQNQQAMMQQQALLAQSQQNQQSSGPIVINNTQQQQGMGFAMQRGKPVSTGYLLWCCCFFFICGAHRFYYNKPISGIIYVLTFGLFGFGQLYDLLVMPELAKSA